MQFKHPEILWALLLLLIPIIVHLFQLRRFKKTPFTNVAMLQQVVSESRKSSTIKKWLLLLTRLLLLAALVIAFAQPFFAKGIALKEKETVIYLDDSFSMQAKTEGLTLLEKAVQDLAKTMPGNSKFSLFTNKETFTNVDFAAVQNSLLSLTHDSDQLSFDDIVLKANTLFSTRKDVVKNLIVISDFQKRMGELNTDSKEKMAIHLVALKPNSDKNVSIDSLFIGNSNSDQIELHTLISGLSEDESLPISIYNGSKLIAKTAAQYNADQLSSTIFSLPKNELIKGRVSIADNGLAYDNSFYFSIDERPKIKVLSIEGVEEDFLSRIYTDDEFEYSATTLANLNYSKIAPQNLVVLNGLESLPISLITVLQAFVKEGGHLVFIPSSKADLDTYNNLYTTLLPVKFLEPMVFGQRISKINFDNPIYANVFEKRVTNFDYPNVQSYYRVENKAATILSFANNEPFLVGNKQVEIFTAPLNSENSNFKNSPLIVPTFYNMALKSLKSADLYLQMGDDNVVDVATQVEKDNIVKLMHDESEFIPLQKSYTNKLRLYFQENPALDGIYAVVKGKDTLQHISFNFTRDESQLTYLDLDNIDVSSVQNTIPALFQSLNEDNTITQYWKWFVIFALVFVLMEILIQKFLA
ncbi:MAG: VWA domain-containing protein [Croceitalea sp.]|nr:VWA domain-containing protein [Croceitalea sp.]